jgi:hypothetical protein
LRPEIETFNDKDTKAFNLERQVGERPVFVAGNVRTGGDIGQMRYSRGRSGPNLQILINHDDPVREFAYSEPDNESLKAASKYGFTVVSMRRDWRTIFPARERVARRANRTTSPP